MLKSGCDDAGRPQGGQQLVDLSHKLRGPGTRVDISHSRTGGDGGTGRAGGTSGAHCAGGTRRAGRAGRTGGTDFTGGTRRADRAGRAGRTNCAGGTRRTGRAGRTDCTGSARRASRAGRAGGTNCTGGASSTGSARRANRTGRAGGTGGGSHLCAASPPTFPTFSQSPVWLPPPYGFIGLQCFLHAESRLQVMNCNLLQVLTKDVLSEFHT